MSGMGGLKNHIIFNKIKKIEITFKKKNNYILYMPFYYYYNNNLTIGNISIIPNEYKEEALQQKIMQYIV